LASYLVKKAAFGVAGGIPLATAASSAVPVDGTTSNWFNWSDAEGEAKI
jgi:hypothetical protein